MPCTVYGGAIYNVIYYYLSAKYAGEAGIVFTSIISICVSCLSAQKMKKTTDEKKCCNLVWMFVTIYDEP